MAKYFSLNLIKTRYKAVLLITCFVIALVLFITSLLPLEYESNAQLLIIQDEVEGDLYVASKAAERLGTSLSKVIYTTSFYNKVVDSNIINENYFSANEVERRKEWDRAVKAEVVPQTSILKIYTYSTDQQKAQNIAAGIAYVLSTSGSDYYGEGNDVSIKVVNPPITSINPVKPNIYLNAFVALVVGMLISMVYLMFVDQVKKARPVSTKEVKKNEIKKEVKVKEEEAFNFEPEPEPKPVYSVLDMGSYRQLSQLDLEPLEIKPLYSMYDHLR